MTPTEALTNLVAALDAFLAGEHKTDRVMPERMRTAYRNAKATLASVSPPADPQNEGRNT